MKESPVVKENDIKKPRIYIIFVFE